ncbi:tubulin-tyrosine ligase family protein [Yasminevirus sp. GU-2018]|uniref:Tubulin-tyrosine ligase family protein n=1 Tax=Yasminevirus sp. GU-2018 TaxID=2420051 RepID=A0A5K0U8Z8_9VIRU|nr:tubulin-tyrosine ligase family protein [Yasminevirus sp. GU-2018]
MTITETALWAVVLSVVCVFIYIVIRTINSDQCLSSSDSAEHMINIPPVERNCTKWTRTSSCKYYMDDTTSRVLGSTNVTKTDNYKNADIIFPCGYNNIDDEIKSLPNVYYKDGEVPRRVFIIDGADEITAKNYLWKNIHNHHGLRKAKEMAPNTYLLVGQQRNIDIARLEKEHYPGKMYILKKNIQRQTGLELTDNINIIKNNPGRYVLAQELLEDSYLVSGRKINLRVYLVVVCNKEATDVYMFNNGFMYYTKRMFVKGDKSRDNHITTGYVERDVYHKNPLTHSDFKKYLDMPEGEKYHPSNNPRKLYPNEVAIRGQGLKVSDVVFKRIEKLLADVFISFKGNICRKQDSRGEPVPIYNDYSVQIFGADVAINDQLQPQIIEINKGPDLSPKDDRDGNVKRKMFGNVLEVIGIKPKSEDNGLIHILEM